MVYQPTFSYLAWPISELLLLFLFPHFLLCNFAFEIVVYYFTVKFDQFHHNFHIRSFSGLPFQYCSYQNENFTIHLQIWSLNMIRCKIVGMIQDFNTLWQNSIVRFTEHQRIADPSTILTSTHVYRSHLTMNDEIFALIRAILKHRKR